MLNRPVPLSRPPPSARALLNSSSPSSPPAISSGLLSSHPQLTDSPLSQAATMLKERLPGVIEFKSCGSFAEGWTPDPNPDSIQSQSHSHSNSNPQSNPHSQNQLPLEQPDLSQQPEHDQQPKLITQEWVSAKSRQELESLLLAADRVIRERERDLGIAASIGKSLLENNIALRARQEKLLAHLAAADPVSPPAVENQFEDLSNRSEYIEARPPPSPLELDHNPSPIDFVSSPSQSPTTTHARFRYPPSSATRCTPANQDPFPHCFRPDTSPRSSISSVSSFANQPRPPAFSRPSLSPSPATLNRLAQQNEYLAGQLAALEAETAQSELQGRKRLRKLVKELDTLRQDLRQTEERNALLEDERLSRVQQTPLQGVGSIVDEIVGGMKRVMMEDVDESSFESTTAPPPRPVPHIALERPSTPTPAPLFDQRTPAHPLSRSQSRASSLSGCSPDMPNSNFQSSPAERALVSQLLAKISELKESQAEFDGERAEMEAKLSKARSEVDELRIMVEQAEGELEEVRQLGWTAPRGLIGWQPDEDDEAGSSRRATGNRKMIAQKKKKSNRKRLWPAVEHHAGSIDGEMTPNSMGSVASGEMLGESPSPCIRARSHLMPLGRAARGGSEDERDQQLRVLRAVGVSSASLILGSEDGDGSVRLKKDGPARRQGSPLRTLLAEMEGVEGGLFQPEGSHEAQSPSLSSDARLAPGSSDSSRRALQRPPSSTKRSYAELRRAVAELPVSWADEEEEGETREEPIAGVEAKAGGKQATSGWLYDALAGGSGARYVESWTATSAASVGLMASRPKVKAEAVLRQRRLLMQASDARVGSWVSEDGQSTLSSSTMTLGRQSGTSSEEQQGGEGEGEEEESDSVEEGEWKYVGAADHDGQAQGAAGTDYYPTSLRARNAPGMVARRLQMQGASWTTFVREWVKLVGVIGLAVGWAIWQGPGGVVGAQKEEQVGEEERRGRLAIEDGAGAQSRARSASRSAGASASGKSGGRTKLGDDERSSSCLSLSRLEKKKNSSESSSSSSKSSSVK